MPSAAELIGLGEAPKLAGLIGNLPSAKTGVGTTQAGATPITTNFTVLTTAGGATGFLLPTVPAGSGPYFLFVSTSTTATIFPPVGGSIQGAATDAKFDLAQNKGALFYKISSTAWAVNLSA
jgi:hypothetical protein